MGKPVSMMRMRFFLCSRVSRRPRFPYLQRPAWVSTLMKNSRKHKNGNSGKHRIGDGATAPCRIGKGTNMTDPTQSLFFASGYVTAEQAGIHSFLFDEATGELTVAGSFTGINAPSFILMHPNRKHLYAVSETGQGSHGTLGEVWAFQFEREPFNLQPLNHQTTSGDWPCHLQLDATGNWLLVTNYGTGNAAMYPLQSNGSIGEMVDFIKHHGKGPHVVRQEAAHTHSSIFT